MTYKGTRVAESTGECAGAAGGHSGAGTRKRVLDVACGSKMFYFDKHNPDVEFCDIRDVDYHEYYEDVRHTS